MKLSNSNNTKVETNLENSNSFKIAMNSKTFRMLSDTLYSDKKKAVVRELACNAYDAQRAAGTLQTHKIYIQLPTITESIFRVRDYGTGMNEDILMSLYLTYGESTKDKSNDDIGCFGIGSKSPFAYTDLFTVTSFVDGNKKSYSVFLEDGIPKCVKVFEEPTIEENGLEVQFNVEEKDILSFEEAAKKVFKDFDILPEFNIDLEIPREKYDIENDDFCINLSSSYYASKKITALQGNISYPVLNEMIEKLPFRFDKLLLKFNIGDFAFAPSREAISYDKETIDNINKKLKLVETKIIQEVSSKIKESENLYKYIMNLNNYKKQLDFTQEVLIKNELDVFNDVKIDLAGFSNLDVGINNFKMMTPAIHGTKPLTFKKPGRRDTFKSLMLDKEHIILINDLHGKGGTSHLLDYYTSGKITNKYFIILDEDYTCSIENIEKVFGKVFLLSEYVEYDENKIKEKKIKEKFKPVVSLNNMFEFIEGTQSLKTISELKEKEIYYYIPLVRKNENYNFSIELYEKKFSNQDAKVIHLINLIKNNDSNIKIIFVKKQALKKKFLEKKNIILFEDYLKDNFKKIFSNYIKFKKYNDFYNNMIYTSYGLANFFKHNMNNVALKTDKTFDKYRKVVKYYTRFYAKLRYSSFYYIVNSNLLKGIYDILSTDDNKEFIDVDVDIKEDLFGKYPMLKFVNSSHFKDESFIEYIKLVQERA